MNWMWVSLGLFNILAFAAIESYAIRYPERQNTLSRAIWSLGRRWPLSICLFGVFVGGLAVHFFWQWCPV